ncbi:Cna protein B-type domain protein [Streptomyces sp. YIM 130001]|uniref:choice-of-anchor P family protein n=1 Tax=Streptomyces sp. YIM 130001 TaxID=2259644 RepID=UPI000E659C4B|nr:choice-of-anchor P family protein [Streptomyces sp. YIM 130001]RII14246.1 Cna protein B-type domain protein [Streptomyces sp. YIM 130001]
MASVKMGVAGRAALGAVFAATLVAQAAGMAHAAAGSSSAYGVKATLGPINVAEAAPTAYPGGPGEATVANVSVGGVGSVQGVSTTSTGNDQAGTTKSTSKIAGADLNLTVAQLATDAVTTTCDAKPGSTPTGAVSIVNGTAKAVTPGAEIALDASPAPNTKVTLPANAGEVVLNEQTRNADGSLTVNALHVKAAGGPVTGDLVIGSATCKAGTADQPKTGAITATSVDEDGDRVAGVAYDLKTLKSRAAAPSCTGNNTGSCTFDDLQPGSYQVCVTDVPDGYSMPAQRCSATVAVDGNHRHVRFVIPEEHGKKD